jgi:hypothetical protein
MRHGMLANPKFMDSKCEVRNLQTGICYADGHIEGHFEDSYK